MLDDFALLLSRGAELSLCILVRSAAATVVSPTLVRGACRIDNFEMPVARFGMYGMCTRPSRSDATTSGEMVNGDIVSGAIAPSLGS